ncbi:hypothetical protein [Peribacillus glennii]|uniref:Uncharacterized protein n=1 Tax=Peribacillus glennii TaxID=2303991 RepID=A0A372LFG8_9BACI|nr:hypothetical protein [Peribacillus glennii]RFU65028.1 hypothetical protein D0466_03700 [Peribacillus glennii]
MEPVRQTQVSIPSPSRWGIHAAVGGRPVVYGTLNINSVSGNRVTGTINFRGRPIPINGHWNPGTRQIQFESPYAVYSGNLTIFDDPSIRVRHFLFRGRLRMKPPSLQAGQFGTWVATTESALTGPPVGSQGLPPAGAFLTSEILYGTPE